MKTTVLRTTYNRVDAYVAVIKQRDGYALISRDRTLDRLFRVTLDQITDISVETLDFEANPQDEQSSQSDTKADHPVDDSPDEAHPSPPYVGYVFSRPGEPDSAQPPLDVTPPA